MRRSTLLIGVLAVAATAGTITGRWLRPSESEHRTLDAPLADLHIESQQLDFGEVWETDRLIWPITVENRGSRECRIDSMMGSCTCQTFTPDQFILAPGSHQKVEVALNLRQGLSRTDLDPIHEFQATIWARQGTSSPQYWSLHGQVRAAFRSPNRVDLGVISERESAGTERSFPVVPLVPLSRLNVSTDNNALIKAALTQPNPARNRYEVAVRTHAGLSKGLYRAAVQITAVRADGTTVPTIRIPITFEIGEDIQAVPINLELSARDVGETVQEFITLRSRSGAAFTIRSVRTEGAGLTAEPIQSVVDPGLMVYRITQRVGRIGPGNGRILFTLDVPNRDGVELTVPVAFSGHATREPKSEK